MAQKKRVNLTLPQRLFDELSRFVPKGKFGQGWSRIFEAAVRARISTERSRDPAPKGLGADARKFILDRLRINHELTLATKQAEGRYEGWLFAKYFATQHALESIERVEAEASTSVTREASMMPAGFELSAMPLGYWITAESRTATDLLSLSGLRGFNSGPGDNQSHWFRYEEIMLAAHARETCITDDLIHDSSRP